MMKHLFAVLLVLAAFSAYAQPKFNSPYSRYGLGDLSARYLGVQAGRGGMTAAFNDPYHLNLGNPASFATLRATALETGINAKYGHYTANATTLDAWSGNLSYFALGFTLKNPINEALDRSRSDWRHGMGFSLTPYSQVGYNIQTQDTLPDLGAVRTQFEGSGGTYQLAWHGASKYKNTSFGATLGWLFGRSVYENTTSFIDSLPTFQSNFRDEVGVSGLTWNLGVQHDFVFQYSENDKTAPSKWLTIGGTFSSDHQINTTADQLRLRSRGKTQSNAYADADTLLYLTDVNGKMTLPGSFSIGLDYVKLNKMRIGAQFAMDQWANYKSEARPITFRNTYSVSGGLEYIPDAFSYNRYMKRVRYRIGGYYRQDPRSVNGVELDDVGISLGMGFPLILPRQQTSFINFAVEAGKLGANSPIEESYIRMTFGFTFNDNSWFFKRRFE